MSDLISRQAAIDAIDIFVKVDEENCTEYDIGYNDGIDFAISSLSVLPSAQPEIVRCKDCKFGNISSMGHLAVCGHEKGLVDPVPDSYCSYAERRTDEQI